MTQYNCLIVDDEAISRTFLEHFIGQIGCLNLIGSSASAAEALHELKREKIDIIFLDIEMPEKNGLQFLDELSARPAVVLVTVKEQYAVMAFEYEVVDYLVKPITFSRFEKAVQKARKFVDNKENESINSELFIKTSTKLIKLKLPEILYIEAHGDYVQVCCRDRRFLTYYSMSEILKKLPRNHFFRVHRSYIVNINAITNISENKISIGGREIPVGASYKKDFIANIRK